MKRFFPSVLAAIALVLFLTMPAHSEPRPLDPEHSTAVSLGEGRFLDRANRPRPATQGSASHRVAFVAQREVENLPVPLDSLRASRGRKTSGGLRAPLTTHRGGRMRLADLDPSPLPSSGFQGATDETLDSEPSDASGAVGPSQILTLVSGRIVVQDRSGQQVTTLALNEFFSTLGNDLFCYDARCLYEPYSGRWILTAAADPQGAESGLVIAVSVNDDALGDWYRRFIPLGVNTGLFSDSPVVGFNRQWIVIQADLFHKSIGSFAESQIVAFDKEDLLAGGPGLFARFHLSAEEFGGGQIPALMYDGSLDELYFVKNWTGKFTDSQTGASEGLLRVFTLSGKPGSEVLTPGEFVSTLQESLNPSFVWADVKSAAEELGRQNGTSRRIALGDSRIQSVFYRGTSLWCAQTVLLPADNPTHTGVQWWEIFPDGRLFQRHLVEDPTAAWSYAYPSMAVNNHFDVLIAYNAFSSSVYPSAYYRFYPNEGVYNQPRADQLMKAGEGIYLAPGTATTRWGDWSLTCLDPWNDGAFWTLQAYSLAASSQDSNRWGVWWSSATPFYDLGLTLSSPESSLVVGQEVTWAIALTNSIRSFAYNVTASQSVPRGVEILRMAADDGVVTLVDGVLFWDLSQLGMTSVVCRVTGRVTGDSLGLTNEVEVTGFGLEQQLANNHAGLILPLGSGLPTVAPTLGVAMKGTGAFILSWPVGYLGYALETRDTLAEGGWTRLNSTPIAKGSRQEVVVPTSRQRQYFRLVRQ